MFTPNLVGEIAHAESRDIHGRLQYALFIPCQFAVVNAKRQSEKTSVRADSSASRGAADEITAGLSKILIAKHETVEIGDLFAFDGDTYEISSKHIRRTVAGVVDHFECDIRIRPR